MGWVLFMRCARLPLLGDSQSLHVDSQSLVVGSGSGRLGCAAVLLERGREVAPEDAAD
jgi:hypothetical protein